MVTSHLLGAADIRALADEVGLRPTKRWGQNFVIDPNTVERIVRASRVGADDLVVEVGPGLGSLTLALLPQVAGVVAVEIDPTLAARLPRTVAERAPDFADRLTVVSADALDLPPLGVEPSALVANLPYNVAVPVLLRLLADLPSLRTALVMVQREVAERLAAAPGSRTYGVPSVKARWFAAVESAGVVGTRVFWPEPRVESGLVRLTRHDPPACRSSRAEVFAVVDAAFGQRRKSLRGALAALAGSPDAAERALLAAGVPPATRGEALDVADFARIADALSRPPDTDQA